MEKRKNILSFFSVSCMQLRSFFLMRFFLIVQSILILWALPMEHKKRSQKKIKSILDRVDCAKNISRIAQTSLHNHFRHLHRNYKNFPLHSQDGGVCLRMGITLLFAWAEWRWDEGCGSFQRIFFFGRFSGFSYKPLIELALKKRRVFKAILSSIVMSFVMCTTCHSFN